uniref:ZP domain-containing protein n=1 Tax=Labrus bergylta TaxID=56723 RepID=A0A3Q3FRG3_9LABR
MSLVACILWTLFSGSLGGPVPVTDEVQTYHHLPMFLDAPEPVIAQELFLPVPHKRPVPAGITSLLLPVERPQQSVQGTGTRAVEVFCGGDGIRVDRFQVRSWTNPYLFSLGTCRVTKVTPRFLYFHYKLTECGGESQIVGGQLVYSFTLSYTPPPPQGFAIRVMALTLPLHCHYNRFHYSYKVGFRPQVQPKTFLKSTRSKLSFSLTVCNEHWEPVPEGQEFVLGELVYFIAQSGVLLAGESLYVDSCYATSTKDPDSQLRVDIITNYGCMTDSRREGSSSYFLSAGGAVLKFSVDALLFRAVSQVLYLHCSMSVSLTTSHVSKSCNYNTAAGRWEELEASPSVCSCCDSTCTDGQDGEFRTSNVEN